MKSVEKSIDVASAERFLRIIAALTDSASIRTYLEGVGLPARGPTDRGSSSPPDLPSRSVAGRTAGCAFNGSPGPRLIRIRADRQPNCTASSVEGLANDPLRELEARTELQKANQGCGIWPVNGLHYGPVE